MSREIWLGPVLGSNRERLLARCARLVSAGEANRLLYIAASHPLLDIATEKLLDGAQTPGVWGEFPIYLFRGFVRQILSSTIVSEARPSGRPTLKTVPLLTRGLLTPAIVSEARPTGVPTRAARVGWSTGKATLNTEPLLTRGLLTRVAIDREELPLRRSLVSQL